MPEHEEILEPAFDGHILLALDDLLLLDVAVEQTEDERFAHVHDLLVISDDQLEEQGNYFLVDHVR
jgi:hypothetical protein